jgi:3-(3-hydroxy-phenyl)propionate hydroxylase
MTHSFTQQQTIENMELMRGGQNQAHLLRGEKMRSLQADGEARRRYLLRQSMISSLKEAADIA